ncbi:cystatin-B-like [Sycon ciliatum]|uniref:cystatin-B-like n=1 Tax=Sycon ciliatum TaxID=27933 RepID=UPI0031F66299
MSESAQKLGGWSSPPKEANEKVQAICFQVRKAVEDKINGGHPLGQFTAKEYIEQVIEGMNYRIKVQINTVSKIRIEVCESPIVPVPPYLTAVAADGPLNDQPF